MIDEAAADRRGCILPWSLLKPREAVGGVTAKVVQAKAFSCPV